MSVAFDGARPRTRRHREIRASAASRRFDGVCLAAVVLGAVLVVVAYQMAKSSTSLAHFYVFWLGFLLGLAAIVLQSFRGDLSRTATWAWLGALSLLSFLPKFLMSLHGPVYYDEYNHIRHVQDILSTGNPGATSSYGSIIQYYPGIHLLTIGVHEVTRLSPWNSGQLVLLAAHTAALGFIVAIGRTLRLTNRQSFAAAIVYSLNPSFVYFDTQFSYESLAVPFALGAIWCTLKCLEARTPRLAGQWIGGGVLLAACSVVTHHISSFFMVGACLLIALLVPVETPGGCRRLGSWVITLFGGGFLAFWVTQVAKSTGGYLNPHLSSAFSEVSGLFSSPSGSRSTSSTGEATVTQHTPFAGSTAPYFERLCAYATPFIVLILLVVAAVSVVKGKSLRSPQVLRQLPFLTIAAAYFASLPVALTVAGGEAAHRSWAFSYVGIAVLTPRAGSVLLTLFRRRTSLGQGALRALVVSTVAVLSVGNIAAGENVSYRFPGPYEFASDTRSSTPELKSLASWMDSNLQDGTGVVSDRFTSEVINGYTDLRIVGRFQGGVFGLFQEGAALTPSVTTALKKGNFRYFVLDTHILSQVPSSSFYAGYKNYSVSINRPALASLSNSTTFVEIHRTPHYIVYRLALP